MKKQNKKLATVYHTDLYGKRQQKYDFLNNNTISSINWNKLENREPEFFFVQKDWEVIKQYQIFFKINDIFNNISGVQTGRDKLFIDFDYNILKERIKYLLDNDLNDNFIQEYNIKDSSSYNLIDRIKKCSFDENNIVVYNYKPFHYLYIYYDKVLLKRSFYSLLKSVFKKENYGLILMRSLVNTISFSSIFISKNIIDLNFYGFQSYYFPLYLYPNKETEGVFAQEGLSAKGRKPNLNMEIVDKISKKIGLKFIPEIDDAMISKNNADGNSNSKGAGNSVRAARELPHRKLQSQYFAPIDILDYIYAVLHSPNYRKKYKEFLKIDFPRVPYPNTLPKFRTLAKLGAELRKIHLLESPKLNEFITSYPIDGTNKITTKITKKDWEINIQENNNPSSSTDRSRPVRTGRIYINETQYFNNIPLIAWEFYIGGYQPAQKWLKDRAPKKGQEGRTLTYEDIIHYQKIIVALTETDRIMKEIDKIDIE